MSNTKIFKIRHWANFIMVLHQMADTWAEDIFQSIEWIEAMLWRYFSLSSSKYVRRDEFRAMRRKRNATNVVRQAYVLEKMPSGLIHDQDEETIRKIPWEIFEEQVHHFGIGARQYKGTHFAEFGANSGEDVNIFPHYLPRGDWPDSGWSPSFSHVIYTTETPSSWTTILTGRLSSSGFSSTDPLISSGSFF